MGHPQLVLQRGRLGHPPCLPELDVSLSKPGACSFPTLCQSRANGLATRLSHRTYKAS